MRIPYFHLLISLVLVWGTALPCFSQKRTSVFDALTKAEGDRVSIDLDLTTVTAQKRTNDYFPATITGVDGRPLKMEVRARGKFRRKNAVYPPLKLKFKKKELLAIGLDTMNEIKLVLPCYDNRIGDELVIREYLAYKIFEALSPVSIRAKLIRLTIHDTHVEKSKKTMFAILIEDMEETCARLGGAIRVEDYGIPADSLHTNQAAIMIIFQYMIGNTDWDIAMLRNVRMIKTAQSSRILTLPYDFDFSGLVGAPYATPNSDTGLKTVRDRFLMANGVNPNALKIAIEIVKKAKSDIYDICHNRYLSRDAEADMTKFLDSFFARLGEGSEVPQMMQMPHID
ncbi:MAG: hypothetical protein H6576_02705 [Lewinellaceae bacterium]|nr:hypothetical protein [Saprospiraceae bacterium]MCB9342581.1 hypothetical protein [Lewinellaceae bacterium]